MKAAKDNHLLARRRFLKMLGVSSAGVTTAAAMVASREMLREGGENAREEIEKLQAAYEDLDQRSNLILRLILAATGLDIFLAL